ncbi:MAG: membrane protein insertion efficiency factor YidD, partial [Aliifodinibius sp.]|nr:membrane protein insertion efficiency factor YidD [Fodinibius sp.]NIV13181.1 membrane protein insertion efficiency factor YidD [Fodinibius sp.]NIY29967.1 membrane protein insertion efficiency factor YidD [Fodinibius sp.]
PKNPLKGTTKIEKGDSKPSKDVVNKVFSAPIMFWRKIMSRHWGIKCSHYPSCSQYSLLA